MYDAYWNCVPKGCRVLIHACVYLSFVDFCKQWKSYKFYPVVLRIVAVSSTNSFISLTPLTMHDGSTPLTMHDESTPLTMCNERPNQATETPSVEKHAHPPRVVYCAIYLTLTLITKFRVSNLHFTTR